MEKSNENLHNLRQYIEKHKPQIEKSLRAYLPVAPPNIETEFNEAIEHALFSGGNRLRPVLTLLAAELFGGKAEDVLPSAVAVEYIFTSSLIFEDLPFMGNLVSARRGKILLHEKYGDGLTVLVALGLLNASYPLVFVNHIGMPERAMQAHQEIVECVGASGLVGGQTVKLKVVESDKLDDFSDNEFESIAVRKSKTSALMRLALRVGAILAGADYLDLAHLSRIAELLGDAYGLSEDLIGLEDNDATSKENKAFASSQSKNEMQNKLNDLIDECKRQLIENFSSNEARSCLIQMTEYFLERKV